MVGNNMIPDPRFNRGRWYEVLIESDGGTPIIRENSLGVKEEFGLPTFPENFHVICINADCAYDKSSPFSSAELCAYEYHGCQVDTGFVWRTQLTYTLPFPGISWVRFYIFGYFE